MSTANETGARPAHRLRGWLLALAETAALTLALFVGVETVVAQPYTVEQVSMEQSLLPGERVVVDKLTPRFEPYRRGDIVVFIEPGTPSTSTPLIKRVIGLPGDVVELRDGRVVVDGTTLDEPYLYPGQVTLPLTAQTRWQVPDGTLFVLGDHREASRDSRWFGPVPLTSIIGRAWLRYWPLDRLEVIAAPSFPPLSGSRGR